ncbi:MAG: flagellar basal body rod protein FlgC [Pirellulaceae bacterium]|jgi:flagellar basal-body rod protein FlgC
MLSNIFSSANISASGMSAERQRMEVIANNIANANSTQSSEGGPYRRQQLIFAAALDNSAASNSTGFRGVEVVGQVADDSELPEVYIPGHEHADPVTGMVTMPNVQIPNEMVDLITASRSYEANLKAMTTFKEMVEQTLRLLRGGV